MHRDAPPPAQRSPGRPPVPLERIVATALQIVDEEGADALSMRTLAQRLNSGTATLYRRFAGRGDLIAHVVDRMFSEVTLTERPVDTAAGDDWQCTCRTLAHAMFDSLSRHPNAAGLLVEQPPLGPAALDQREYCLAALLAGGFTPSLAARAYAMLAHFVLGFAIQFGSARTVDEAQVSAAFHELDPAVFPATLAVADALPVPLDDEFDLGLELILAGLAQFRTGHVV